MSFFGFFGYFKPADTCFGSRQSGEAPAVRFSEVHSVSEGSRSTPVVLYESVTRVPLSPLQTRGLRSTRSITDERAEPLTSDPEVFSPSRAR